MPRGSCLLHHSSPFSFASRGMVCTTVQVLSLGSFSEFLRYGCKVEIKVWRRRMGSSKDRVLTSTAVKL